MKLIEYEQTHPGVSGAIFIEVKDRIASLIEEIVSQGQAASPQIAANLIKSHLYMERKRTCREVAEVARRTDAGADLITEITRIKYLIEEHLPAFSQAGNRIDPGTELFNLALDAILADSAENLFSRLVEGQPGISKN